MTLTDRIYQSGQYGDICIRRVNRADLDFVVALDKRVTGVEKETYWHDIFERYAANGHEERFFLIANCVDEERNDCLMGYIVGEVRAWEFGSEPCGWVFAFSVKPQTRQQGIGEQLFEAISREFEAVGTKTMRTMVNRNNQLHMAFFRSEGMVAGPYIQLEKNL